jgi:hypothetical protein
MRVLVKIDSGALATVEVLVGLFDELSSKLQQMIEVTASIKTEIENLKSQLAAGGMTAEEEAQLTAKIEALHTALNDASGA